ncbi:RrF2 family transcriptional regulator [Hephaestia sp. GCM10023244]|uniref:RrF2 family transcriptional regulator n=1 Tax=unclassified Hephaestia TaxID=2631281 RepID=UPI0020770D81|nr:Rrf2 family transcriptional regulator [Hephaestia sp. MAHUQ-44]MCM8729790.1 Rrf2 family transcriptional regulator [Hephaestia sp. MAHUQ-44]
MRLTTFSDYALRLLMFAASNDGRLITIEETARRFAVSRGHLMKVANELTRAGFLKAVRGRSGGLMLGKPPETMKLSEVLAAVEPDFTLAECFGAGNQCILTPHCRLRRALDEALGAFIGALEQYTIADLVLDSDMFGLPLMERIGDEARSAETGQPESDQADHIKRFGPFSGGHDHKPERGSCQER